MQATFSTARSAFILRCRAWHWCPDRSQGPSRVPGFLLLSLRPCAPTRYEIEKSEDERVDYGAQLGAVWNRLKTAIRSRPITTH